MTHSVKIKIHRTIILTVVLYECETWSLTLREKCRLRVFENRVLRRIFGPKTNGAMGGGVEKTTQQGALCLYSSPDIIRVIKSTRMRWKGHVARMAERRIQGFGGET
jgi:hypothetical protein